MVSIRTILCPVDFTAATAGQVDLAVDLCRAFGARLVLHHNEQEVAIGAAVGWMWANAHPDQARTPEQKLRDLQDRVPAETIAEIRLTRGPVADAVMAVAREVAADLLVMSTRAGSDDVDESVTERVLERAGLPVVAVHAAPPGDARRPRFGDPIPGEHQRLLVATDLSDASRPAVDRAFDLARQFRLDVHLLHVVARGANVGDARRALAALLPADLAGRADLHVETGAPAQAIVRLAHEISAVCIVMGEHARGGLRHWFRPGTPLGVLHRAPCPIWYVPAPLAATRATEVRMPPPARPVANAASGTDRSAAGASLVDEVSGQSFRYWPSSWLYGVVDSREEAEVALADLVAAGAPKDHLQAWHGPGGRKAIDPTGEHHPGPARIWRLLEKATGERALLEQYAAEVAGGHVCIGVRCAPGPARQAAVDILRRHGGHQIAYLSLGSVELMR